MSTFKIAKNATEIRNNSFNLFVNEKYSDEEADDIINSIIKVENYYLKKNVHKSFSKVKSPDCCGYPSKCLIYS